MKYLKIIFPLLFVFVYSAANSQDTTANVLDKGKALYYVSDGKQKYFEGDYRGALLKFREAIQKDKQYANAYFWVAMSHLALNNYEYALKYAEDAIVIKEDADKEIFYLLGKLYHLQGDLDKAVEYYNKNIPLITENRINQLRIRERIAQCERASQMMKDSLKIKVNVMGDEINSRYPDYGPVLADSGRVLYFTSRRQDTKGAGINPNDNQFYEDVYVSFWDETTNSWTEASNSDELVGRLNTDGFDAVNHITSDNQFMYLTINDAGNKDAKVKTESSDICVAKMSNKDKWNSPKNVGKPFNTDYFEGGVTLPLSGDVLYFVSERKKGYGKGDIWVSYGEKRFSKPVNVGDSINTPYEENTPFITKDNQYLFFSSKGHEGMGGYDIYVSKNLGEGWSKPKNIGYPINTVDDDLHFSYDKEYNRAYYSTLPKRGAKGQRDIIEINFGDFNFMEYVESLFKD